MDKADQQAVEEGCTAPAGALGRFVWYELLTEDADKAARFYGQVVGWTSVDAGAVGMDYRLFQAGEVAVCGFLARKQLPNGASMPIHWMGYVAVADVDAKATEVAERGGRVVFEPHDIPNVGRFAIGADPLGAGFAMIAEPEVNSLPRLRPQKAGHGCWHEYHAAGEWTPAFDFYAGLFGWSKAEAMDMGPEGVYQLFGLRDGMLGGMMNGMAHSPHRGWLYYFTVPNIDQAMAAVQECGGRVLFGPQEVPGGGHIIQCLDDQGALFALIGARG